MRPPSRLLLALLALALVVACQVEDNARPMEEPLPASSEDASGSRTSLTSSEPVLSYNERQGRALFLHYCATCHGSEGHGDGFNAYGLDPKPRDLADMDFQAGISDDELAEQIRIGGGAAGLSTAMPPWGRTLNERQIRNLVAFLRRLPSSTDAPGQE